MRGILAAILAFSLLIAPAASAQGRWSNQLTPGQARDSVRDGETVPLSRIISDLKSRYGGELLRANLYPGNNGGKVYRIDWLSRDGRKMEFTVDAHSGRILDRRG